MNNKNQIKNHYRGNLEKGAKDRGIMDKVHNEKIMHDMNKEQKRQVCERDVDCHLNRISNKCQHMIDKNLLTIEVKEKSYAEALDHFKQEMIFRLEVFLSNHASLYSCIDDSVPIKNVFVSFLLMMFKIRWDELATNCMMGNFRVIDVFTKARAFASNFIEFKDNMAGNKCFCNCHDIKYLNEWKTELNELEPEEQDYIYEQFSNLITKILDDSCTELSTTLTLNRFDIRSRNYSEYLELLNEYQDQLRWLLLSDKWYLNKKPSSENSNLFKFKSFLHYYDINSILDNLSEYVYKQDAAKETVSTILYNHIQRLANPKSGIKKKNALIFGPTGSGKTELMRALRHISPVHVFRIDMARIQPEGWRGRSLSNVFTKEKVHLKPGQRLEESIIFLDEIDKIFMPSTEGGNLETYQQDYIANLLGLLEDGVVLNENGEKVCNCEKCTFVLAGAFPELLKDDNVVVSIGGEQKETIKINRQAINNKLLEFGFTKELLGRIGNVQRIYPLAKDDFVHILSNMQNSAVHSIMKEYKLLGIKLKIEKSAIEVAAKYAAESQLGVRGANTILYQVADDMKFDLVKKHRKTATLTGKRVEKYLGR